MNIPALSLPKSMSYKDAFELVYQTVELDAQRSERDAKYFEDEIDNDPDFSASHAAKTSRLKASKLREAFAVLARGY